MALYAAAVLADGREVALGWRGEMLASHSTSENLRRRDGWLGRRQLGHGVMVVARKIMGPGVRERDARTLGGPPFPRGRSR